MLRSLKTHWQCRRVRKRLALFVGDDLTVAERRQVEAHLVTCERCREELKGLELSATALQALAELDATLAIPSLLPELRQRLPHPEPAPARAHKSSLHGALAILGAVGAIVAMLALFGLLSSSRPSNRVSQAVESGIQEPPVVASEIESPGHEPVAPQLDMGVLLTETSPAGDSITGAGEAQCRYTLDLATPMDRYEPALDEY